MSIKGGKGASNRRSHSSLSISDSDNESIPEIECKVCDKNFTSTSDYQKHIQSKKHYNQIQKHQMSVKAKIDKLVEDDSSGDSDNDKYSELTCDVCSMTFSGYKPYNTHLHGSTHAKNLKKKTLKEKMKDVPGVESDEESEDGYMPKTVAKCKLCEKDFQSLESFQKHLGGSLHKKNLKREKILKAIKDEHKESDGEMGDDFYKKCEVCDKEFSGLQPYQVHMRSLVHKKALKRIEMAKKIKDLCSEESTEKKFICKECKHEFLDPFAFQSHLDHNSHKKYEAKSQMNDIVNSYPEIAALKMIQNVPEDSDDQDEYKIGDYVLVCKLCHSSFSGPQSALDHVKSKRHIKTKRDRAAKKMLRESQQNTNTAQNEDKSHKKPENGAKSLKMLNGATKVEEEEDGFEHI